MQNSVAAVAASMPGASGRRRVGSFGDTVFEWLCRLSGLLLLAILGAIIISLFIGGLPAFQAAGIGFIWSAGDSGEQRGRCVPARDRA